MPTRLSLKEALEQRDRPSVASRGSSASLADFALQIDGALTQPVDLARLLMRFGYSLTRAHADLERIAAGERICVSLQSTDDRDVERSFRALGVAAARLKPPTVTVSDVRQALKLTQAEFARRFGFELATVRNWEQGRNRPDLPTSVLLAIIERRPDIVDEVMADMSRQATDPDPPASAAGPSR